jgi:NADH dehydrogenase (ubiquinone) Fe-S protein 2
LILTLCGEKIVFRDPHIGLLHRGTEKLLEYKTVLQSIPYFDRLDYVSRRANEHVFVLSVEKIMKIEVDLVSSYNRLIVLELTRIMNHLIALTTHIIDVGAITPFLWIFEEREKLFEIYENIRGARIHFNWIEVGGVKSCLTLENMEKIFLFISNFATRIDEMEELITNNRIWCARTIGVGVISSLERLSLSCSGVRLRATGIKYDLRINESYERYKFLNFIVPVGYNGDCYDRYLLRLYEMRESIKLIFQSFDYLQQNYTNVYMAIDVKKNTMEELILHFKNYTRSAVNVKIVQSYVAAEAPKGEFGVYILNLSNSQNFYRVKIKAPGLRHLFRRNYIITNHYLADRVTILGTQDIVFGEIDR